MIHIARHSDRVLAAAGSRTAHSWLAASWRRSALRHGLDPSEHRATAIVEGHDLSARRERLARLIEVSTSRLNALFHLVGHSGCAVLLTDAKGVVLEHRVPDGDARVFVGWGLRPGADWSEASEGTNGIGTCLAEGRQVIIHRDQHFYARNTAMSCIDAPIYGSDGQIAAALDVSSARSDQTASFNRLIASQVAQTARAIEEAHFRSVYHDARLIQADGSDGEGAVLLAVDQDDLVIGATRLARLTFGLERTGQIRPRPAVDLLGQAEGPRGFDKAQRAAVIRALNRAEGNVSHAARALGISRATLYRRMKRLEIGD